MEERYRFIRPSAAPHGIIDTKTGNQLFHELQYREELNALAKAREEAEEKTNIVVTNLSFLLGGLGIAPKAPSMTEMKEDVFYYLGDQLRARLSALEEALERIIGMCTYKGEVIKEHGIPALVACAKSALSRLESSSGKCTKCGGDFEIIDGVVQAHQQRDHTTFLCDICNRTGKVDE